MSRRTRFLTPLLLATLALAPFANAAEEKQTPADPTPAPAPVTPPAAAPHLGVPLVTKLDWGVSSLAIADIDGDGRNDIAILNNETGRVEILYRLKPGETAAGKKSLRRNRWEPVVDDAPFRRESVAGDAAMLSLAVGDVNGDGLQDIVFTSERSGLNVVLQDPKGEWNKRLKDKRNEASKRSDALRIADIDGTGKPSIVQLTKNGIAVYRITETEPKRLPEPQTYRTDGANGALVVANILGEEKPAVGTINYGEESVLRLRLPAKTGTGYGPEITLRVPCTGMDFRGEPLDKSLFVAVNARRRNVSTAEFIADTEPLDGAESAALFTYSPANEIAGVAQVAALDVTGDGVEDLVVADAKAAQILVYLGLPSGDFAEAIEYPSLAGITALAPIAREKTGKKIPALLALSEKENIVGLITFADGKPAFPRPLALEGKPVFLANYGNTAAAGINIVATKDDNGNITVRKISEEIAGEKKPEGEIKTEKLFEIESGRREITGIRLADIDGTGRPALLAFADREAMRIWTQDPEGKFAEVAKDSALRKSILNDLSPADIGVVTGIDDTGKPALLVAAQGYIRALRLDEKGELQVLFQANSRRSDDRLRCPLFGKFTEKENVLLAYNESDKSLEWMTLGDDGVFRTKQQIATGALAPFQARLQTVPTEKTPRLVFISKDRITQIPTAKRGLGVKLKNIFETNVEGFTPTGATTCTFAGDIGKTIVLVDPRSHIMEVIQTDAQKHWSSALNFILFEDNPHYRGRRGMEIQPREMRTGDLTGDGLDDVILLMHDRILIYPQQ